MSSVIDRIGQLLAQLQAPDPYQREQAVRELAIGGEDEALAGLMLALEDPDPGIRELAAGLLVQMKGETASQLMIRSLSHRDIGMRNLAAEVLVRIGRPAVRLLIEAVDNDDHDVRKFVIDVLGLIKDDVAVEPLCGCLSDENSNVACSAAEALGEIGSGRAVTALVAAYDRTECVRLQVVEALGKIGDPSALDALFTYVRSDDPLILHAAIKAIGRIGLQDSIGNLRPYLDHKDTTIAEAAFAAIINISVKHGVQVGCDLPLGRFTGFLFDGIKNKDKNVTEFTRSCLTERSGHEIVKYLLDVLDFVDGGTLRRLSGILREAGPSVAKLILERFASASSRSKLALLDVIKQFIDDGIAEKLGTFADDPDPEVRQRVAYTLGMAGYTGAVPTLKRLAVDEVGDVRAAAFSAFGWLCSEEEVDFLFIGLQDKYSDVREAAMGALVIAGGPKVVAKFAADLYHQDAERQRLAVTALGLIGEAEVVDPLIKAVSHPQASVRKSAINALARMGEVPVTQPIRLALRDENRGVRRAAISALVAMQGERAVPEIRFLLDDEDVWVRYHTICSIGDLGFDKFSGHLTPYLHDEQEILKIAATKALVQMGSKRVLPELRRLRREKSQKIVKAAEIAISGLGKGQQ